MKNSKNIYRNSSNIEDVMNLFECKYSDMLENTDKLDKLYWDMEREGIDEKTRTSVKELINALNDGLKKIYNAEEFLYKEMKNILPEQSSVTALKSENETILKLMDSIKSDISNIENLKKQKDLLQAEMVAIGDLIKRNINKKTYIFFHEVRTMLPEEKCKEIIQKINQMIYLPN